MIFSVTSNSEIDPFSTVTFWSWTQAPSTLSSVLAALSIPFLMASSKLILDVDITSVILAIVIAPPCTAVGVC